MKIPYRPHEEKIVCGHKWRENSKSPHLRNSMWVEIKIIGEEKIRSVFRRNQDALELLKILQTPISSLYIPDNIDRELKKWSNRLK